MRLFTDQAELFVVAAACMAAGIFLLYLALGLWGMLLDRALKKLGLVGALVELYVSRRKSRPRPWWYRVSRWLDWMDREP